MRKKQAISLEIACFFLSNTTTNLGFATGILFLLLGQGLVAVAFFADFVADVLGKFLTDVGTIGVADFILLVEEIHKLIAIVYLGGVTA